MPYTYRSLTFMWLIALGLFALTASGAVAGRWVLACLLIALAAPALVLRTPRPVVVPAAASRPRANVSSGEDDRSPTDLGRIDVHR
jgi:uncharacterized protein (DUF58 family)